MHRDATSRRDHLRINKLTFKVYKDLGFENIKVALSTRPEKKVGGEDIWNKSEKILESSLKKMCPPPPPEYGIIQLQGAFYGPELVTLTDSLDESGNVEQCNY